MSTKSSTGFFTALYRNPWVRVLLLTMYYGAIIVGLVLLYGKGHLTSTDFVYQGF